jgi:hypothetical protein
MEGVPHLQQETLLLNLPVEQTPQEDVINTYVIIVSVVVVIDDKIV